MNISPYSATNPELLFLNFNQDCGCFVAGTKKGFRIFNTDPLRHKSVHPLDQMGVNEDTEATSGSTPVSTPGGVKGVILAEMLFRCNYVALVFGHRPNCVRIWDDLKTRFVTDLEFNTPVKAVKLRRDRIVVVTQELIKVYTFTATPQALHVFTTSSNPKGLCSLSPASEKSLLAFPEGEDGKVRLFDLADPEKRPAHIQAHSAKLSCLTLNIQGTRLATASDKGTLIRIFNTDNCELLSELRRGSQPATIYSINFSSDSTLLCVSSSHGTIHVFALDDPKRNETSSLASSGFLSSNILPKYFSSEWSFSRIEIPGSTPAICAFGSSINAIIALCSDGSYYKYLFEKGNSTRDVYQQFLELAEG